MASNTSFDRVHRSAFEHYLRTGQRLTNNEWLVAQERKFNPYHDARGRFTSPPGVVVSWGKHAPGAGGQGGKVGSVRTARHSPPSSAARGPEGEGRSTPANDAVAASTLRSEFVRNATIQAGRAETYFDLNERQRGLDRLRRAAGSRPSALVKADLDEIQRRLDADGARLDARRPAIDAQTIELARAGLAPIDIAAGAINVAAGNGKVRDYLSVAGAFPFGAIIRRTGGIIQIGGAQSVVKRLIKAEGISGVELHHVPSRKSMELAGIVIPPSKAPVIAKLAQDHRLTKSWGRANTSKAFRAEVAERLARGDVEGALRMEFGDIEQIKNGVYGHGLENLARYIHDDLKKFKR